MITFSVDNLDPLFVFNRDKMVEVMNDVCVLLSIADGPSLLNTTNTDNNIIEKNGYSFSYQKSSEFDGLNIVFKLKTVFLLKLKNTSSTSIEITLNVKHPEIEMKEIFHLLKPYQRREKSINKPSDG